MSELFAFIKLLVVLLLATPVILWVFKFILATLDLLSYDDMFQQKVQSFLERFKR